MVVHLWECGTPIYIAKPPRASLAPLISEGMQMPTKIGPVRVYMVQNVIDQLAREHPGSPSMGPTLRISALNHDHETKTN